MHLNLTRKWRSKTFDEIVGQKLPVRLLKNSLYRGQLFPVYLLSGLRGSGKTSTGRIFAAAVNCHQLSNFQQKPQSQKLPCLECDSCQVMKDGNHPDFVEIDAASHTGVDNVRQIIEAASFLPVMGTKKIYLIDEVHMLSKAAFNAFLKILEEPPATALFLLATTDPQKIIDTVKSRSFQLFFDPIHGNDLVPHLAYICQQESIEYQEDALALIARESEGSARDALNLIERIRLAEGVIKSDSVNRTLGVISDQHIMQLFTLLPQGSVKAVFDQLHVMDVGRYSVVMIWKKIVEMVRTLMWAHHGVACGAYSLYSSQIEQLVPQYSLALLTEFLDLLYRTEAQFLKTSAQHALLEGVLCKFAQKFATMVHVAEKSVVPQNEKKKNLVDKINQKKVESVSGNTKWLDFLQELKQHGNPLALSIFQQGTVKECGDLILQVSFAKKLEFYHEWLLANENLWKPYMERIFGAGIVFKPNFNGTTLPQNSLSSVQAEVKETSPVQVPENVDRPRVYGQNKTLSVGARIKDSKWISGIKYKKIDVSDAQKWSMAHMLLRMFPGTVHVVNEQN